MLKIARKAITNAVMGFTESDREKIKKASELEDVTDNLQGEITKYIIELSQNDLEHKQSEEIPVLIHNVNDMERIGDHAQNVAELTKRSLSQELVFSKVALKEINEMWTCLQGMLEDTEQTLGNNDTYSAERVLQKEKKINDLQKQFKDAHIKRLNKGKCDISSGFIFTELIDNMEKVGDRLTNIAQSVQNKMRWKTPDPSKT